MATTIRLPRKTYVRVPHRKPSLCLGIDFAQPPHNYSGQVTFTHYLEILQVKAKQGRAIEVRVCFLVEKRYRTAYRKGMTDWIGPAHPAWRSVLRSLPPLPAEQPRRHPKFALAVALRAAA